MSVFLFLILLVEIQPDVKSAHTQTCHGLCVFRDLTISPHRPPSSPVISFLSISISASLSLHLPTLAPLSSPLLRGFLWVFLSCVIFFLSTFDFYRVSCPPHTNPQEKSYKGSLSGFSLVQSAAPSNSDRMFKVLIVKNVCVQVGRNGTWISQHRLSGEKRR